MGPGPVRLDVLEDIAAAGAESFLVRRPPLEIAETAQGVEVVLLGPVQRRLLPQAFEYRMGIVPELGTVRVPIDGAFGGHVVSFLSRAASAQSRVNPRMGVKSALPASAPRVRPAAR